MANWLIVLINKTKIAAWRTGSCLKGKGEKKLKARLLHLVGKKGHLEGSNAYISPIEAALRAYVSHKRTLLLSFTHIGEPIGHYVSFVSLKGHLLEYIMFPCTYKNNIGHNIICSPPEVHPWGSHHHAFSHVVHCRGHFIMLSLLKQCSR